MTFLIAYSIIDIENKKQTEGSIKMTILKSVNRIHIVTSQENLMNGSGKLDVLFSNRLYDGRTFECISDPSLNRLHINMRNEFLENADEARETYDEIRTKLFFEPAKDETPKQSFGDQLQEMMLQVLAQQSTEKVLEMVQPMLETHVINTFGILPQVHHVKVADRTTEFKGITHEKFGDVLNLVSLDIPVFLSGPAGTGKNVMCKQVAEALELDFYFTNAVTQEYQIKGFIDANGTYHPTQFYKAFTEGGLFFLDEIDGSIPETLIMLNSAIANKYFDFPTGKVYAHENFRVISAGNTVGTGADIEYTGRYQLDASSLDRFALVKIDYSPTIEQAVTENNQSLIDFARAFRKATDEAGIKCLFTYRSLERIHVLEKSESFELPTILEMTLTKGLGQDDINILHNEITRHGQSTTKYTSALQSLSR